MLAVSYVLGLVRREEEEQGCGPPSGLEGTEVIHPAFEALPTRGDNPSETYARPVMETVRLTVGRAEDAVEYIPSNDEPTRSRRKMGRKADIDLHRASAPITATPDVPINLLPEEQRVSRARWATMSSTGGSVTLRRTASQTLSASTTPAARASLMQPSRVVRM